MSQGLGYARKRVILEIIKKNWNTDNPESVKLNINNVLFIIQELIEYETKAKVDNTHDKYEVFKLFVKHILHRNLANYDSMLLLTSEKGCLTDDSLLMMPRNLVKYPNGVPLKELIDKGPIKVYSFNSKTKRLEIKNSDGVQFAKYDDVYELELTTGQIIKATADHPFMLMDGTYKELKDLIWLDKIKEKPGASFSRYREGSIWKYTDRLRLVQTTPNQTDFLKIDYSDIKKEEGDTSHKHRMIEHRFIASQVFDGFSDENIIHHKDNNHLNNSIGNLFMMTQAEHVNLHMKNYFFKKGNDFCKATGYSTIKKDKIKNKSETFRKMCSINRKTYFESDKVKEKYSTIMKNNGKHTNLYRYGGVIKSIKHIGKQNVYDVVNVRDNHNFIANGFVVSNTGKSSAGILLAREWCKLIGIRFDPKRHIAYSNKDVMEKIDSLKKFEPLVCLTGDTLINIRYNGKEYEERIDKLVDMKDYEVLTYNEQEDKLEYKTPEKTIEQPIKKAAYTIELEDGKKIKATEDHLVLTKKGYKKIKDLNEEDEIKVYDFVLIFIKIKKITPPKKVTKVYDIINIQGNHNFVANGMVVHNCDEAVRFACLSGETVITTPNGKIKISELEGKEKFEVFSFNKKTKKIEIKKAKKCIKTKRDIVYEITTEDEKKIKATKEHNFLTKLGWKRLDELNEEDEIKIIKKPCKYYNKQFDEIKNFVKIKSIRQLYIEDVYDIIDVEDNNNYIANDFVVHNSSADWNKSDSKELRRKLAEVRTKHLFFILAFPLKIYKMEKNYLESFVNYWCDLFGRGLGAIYVKDKNPVNDPWRIKDFKNVGSYTEFTELDKVQKKLSKHPNFWKVIQFPKPPKWLYDKYLEVRERNVYDDSIARDTLTINDVHKSLLLLALQDVMMNDTTFSMNRIILHVKNQYDIPISKKHVQNLLLDAKQIVNKVREDKIL